MSDHSVAPRQDPLRRRYRTEPDEARITDRARTTAGVEHDPFHAVVRPGSQDYGVEWKLGIHRAVGGDHDLPNPGDLLCAAVATCLDSTIRMIADRMGLSLGGLEVDVTADVDVRGTLVVDPDVPVGFQRMRCKVDITVAPGADRSAVDRLVALAEHCCVNLQTLRSGVPVETEVEVRGG